MVELERMQVSLAPYIARVIGECHINDIQYHTGSRLNKIQPQAAQPGCRWQVLQIALSAPELLMRRNQLGLLSMSSGCVCEYDRAGFQDREVFISRRSLDSFLGSS